MPKNFELISVAHRKTLKRRDTVKHGGRALTLFLSDENPDDFFALLEEAFTLFQPQTARDARLVMEVVYGRWFLLRRQRAYDSYDCEVCTQKAEITQWTADELRQLRLLDKYKIQAERALLQALKNAEYIGIAARRNRSRLNRPWEQWCEIQKEKSRLELRLSTSL